MNKEGQINNLYSCVRMTGFHCILLIKISYLVERLNFWISVCLKLERYLSGIPYIPRGIPLSVLNNGIEDKTLSPILTYMGVYTGINGIKIFYIFVGSPIYCFRIEINGNSFNKN